MLVETGMNVCPIDHLDGHAAQMSIAFALADNFVEEVLDHPCEVALLFFVGKARRGHEDVAPDRPLRIGPRPVRRSRWHSLSVSCRKRLRQPIANPRPFLLSPLRLGFDRRADEFALDDQPLAFAKKVDCSIDASRVARDRLPESPRRAKKLADKVGKVVFVLPQLSPSCVE